MRLPRLQPRHLLTGLLLALVVSACPAKRRPMTREEVAAITFTRLERFESDQAFDNHMALVEDIQNSLSTGGGPVVGCGGDSGLDAPAPAPEEEPSITHNQEAGVDEGDIIKAVGDWFVVLRRGRLFTVRQTEGAMEPVGQVDSYAPGFTVASWYDEMLVYGRRIVVVGYNDTMRATELGLFRMDDAGVITHEGTYFMGSGDYYSSRNYASRLVGGDLILYLPSSVQVWAGKTTMPSTERWLSYNETTPWRPILSRTEVFKPVQTTLWPVLHTLVRCDLDAPEFTCAATALMAPRTRTFYVSRDAVYLWVNPDYESWTVEGERTDSKTPRDSVVYRLPLDGGEPGALRARGGPVDPFSFRQNEDGHLDALLVAPGQGDSMWGPEFARSDGRVALLRAPLDAFSPELTGLRAEDFTTLPGPLEGTLQNRFVGHHVLWGSGEAFDDSTTRGERAVWVTDVRAPLDVHRLSLGHTVTRLEPLGTGGALVVGENRAGLRLTSVALGEGGPELKGTLLREGATQGESRSHGFFFKPDGTGGGVMGLPLRYQGGTWSQLRYGSAEVSFVRVGPELELTTLGSLGASVETGDDACSKSCTDWYGNARPIFYRERVFALMGYELVEAHVTGGAVEESFRVSYLRSGR
ncbi:beta-propeller domain-containing protein [Myxococcus qinghaiensis]|uniref:beta-propeller domain-containing protein n=1 Tax=Myxococcus qinghaiensis TaxID=2906758 RepID=UPI0020A7E6E0|nr:beta-propeller domain-containing protein [Myxococcus qinghaiensis]MCP3169029.1 beta-propeller domain-containing protein [Myxococcus qinghaiensis]